MSACSVRTKPHLLWLARYDIEAVEILLTTPGIDLKIRPTYGELPIDQASTIEMKSLLRAEAGTV